MIYPSIGGGVMGVNDMIMNQGTIKDFFSSIQFPKECKEQSLVDKEGGERKRKWEDDETVEQLFGPERTKSRRSTVDSGRIPEETAIPDGIFKKERNFQLSVF